jgi:hypothetical protein
LQCRAGNERCSRQCRVGDGAHLQCTTEGGACLQCRAADVAHVVAEPGMSSPSMLTRGWRWRDSPAAQGGRKEEPRARPAARHDSMKFYQTLGTNSLSLSFIRMPYLPATPAQRQIKREPLSPSAKSCSQSGPPSSNHASCTSQHRRALARPPHAAYAL